MLRENIVDFPAGNRKSNIFIFYGKLRSNSSVGLRDRVVGGDSTWHSVVRREQEKKMGGAL